MHLRHIAFQAYQILQPSAVIQRDLAAGINLATRTPTRKQTLPRRRPLPPQFDVVVQRSFSMRLLIFQNADFIVIRLGIAYRARHGTPGKRSDC